MQSRILLTFTALILTAPSFGQRVVTSIAGTDWLFPGDGRPAISAPLSGTLGLDVAVDRDGNLHLVDTGNSMAMRVGADGIVNVIAGNGVNFKAGDGGLAINAALLQPISIAVDDLGNVYIGEYGGRIRKVSNDGIITTIAGLVESGYSGDNGPATRAQLYAPYGIAVGRDGTIYISDTLNDRIRKIAPNGSITTIAGTGSPGFSGDGTPATQARLYRPTRIAIDADNNIYFIDSLNGRLRRIDNRGIISTFAGGGDPTLPAARAGLFPTAVRLDRLGNVYVVDSLVQGIHRIDLQGNVSLVAGGSGREGFSGDGGPARDAVFFTQLNPALAIDLAGNIYIADDLNNRIRKIGTDGIIRTVAGNGLYRNSGNGGPATSATLDLPTGIARDPAGNLYVAEPVFNRIRKIAADGTISVYAGNGIQGYSGDGGPATQASLAFPNYLWASSDGYLLFTDSFNCVIRIIDPNGIISTLIGSGECGYNGEGLLARRTAFKAPYGFDVATLNASTLLFAIADTQNHRIRLVPSDTALVVTVAGTGTPGYSGDNGPAASAQINDPVGVRFFGDSLYFCDAGNHRVRRIDSNLIITTVAGNGTKGYSGDNGPATQASLNNPQSITFDSAGNMYIADRTNSAIRRVAAVNGVPRGNITTFAGGTFPPTLGDGGPASDAFLGAPADLLFDPAGNLIFSDQFNNRVRAILAAPPSFTISTSTLAFTAPAGSNPIDQRVEIVGSIPGVGFTTSVSAPWLTVSVDIGVMPATLRVTTTPGNLTPGTYQGTVTILASTASPTTRPIAVTLTITAAGAPSLSVNPSSYSFPFVRNGAARSRPLQISNSGGGNITFTVTIAAAAGGRQWLETSSATGSVGPFGATVLNLTANPATLAAGTYSGTVTVRSVSPAQSVTVPVTMTVSDVQQTILIPQAGLSFFAVQGGGAPPGQFFSILNTGLGQMGWTVRSSTTAGGSWLSAFPGTGVTDAASSLVPQVRVDINPANLNAGIYYGTVQVTAPGADNNPQFVSVILNVLPPGRTIGPIVQPTGLIFVAVAGTEPPGSQTVIVQNTGNAPVTFRSGRLTVDGKSWFTTLPSDATVTQALPVRIVVQPRTDGLAPGTYRGTLTLSFSDATTRNVAIVLVVVPAGSSLRPLSVREATSNCTPKVLAPVFTLISEGSSVPAGFPGQVAVKVVDDCGNPMTTGGVNVSFTNGDPTIRLISLKDGTWAGTWTPERPGTQITITANASAPEQNLKGDVSIRIGLATFDQPPVIGAGGILNTASYALQAPIAPGSFMSLFGSKLALTQAIAGSTPFPEELGGASVLIAGRPAPVYFASDGQVIALVPYGIPVNTSHQAVVSRGTSLSVPQSITVAAAAPGIFTRNAQGTGQGSITDASNRVADDANPVRAGDTIIIYCTGLGEVSPAVPAGTPAPTDRLTHTVNEVTVSIGGQNATVAFAGLAPGYAGLYQVNATIPGGVAPGPAVPVTVSAAGQTSPPVTIVVRQ